MGQVLKLSGLDFSGNSLGTCRNEIGECLKIYDGTNVGLKSIENVTYYTHCGYALYGKELTSVACYLIPNWAKYCYCILGIVNYANVKENNTTSYYTRAHDISRYVISNTFADSLPTTYESAPNPIECIMYGRPTLHKIYQTEPYLFNNASYPIFLSLNSINVNGYGNKYLYLPYVRKSGIFTFAEREKNGITNPKEDVVTVHDNVINQDVTRTFYDTTKVAIDQPKLFWVYED